ncbi:MAG TPA: protein-L-isoaspartate O-methyltransferase [Novosphingobium sp.]|nr:protein-L-isoaspartate O-methyltransferase [Novosphingobium sp.]HZV09481.1 protein-L-isoaspartate O-methyltransferase [Novosphingobium sp.]
MTTTDTAHASFDTARRAMIDSQLRPSGVNEPWVLTAMAATPREDYVPESARAAAYIDRALPLGQGRFLAPAVVQGRLLGEAAPTQADRVLVITGGTGYLTALVSQLAPNVDAVDAADLSAIPGSGYSLIIIDGAIEVLPDALADKLAEGGRIATGLLEGGVTRIATGEKLAGKVVLVALSDLPVPVLPEFAAPKHWSF